MDTTRRQKSKSVRINPRQKIILGLALLLFLLLGFFPPWRYLDGQFAGFHPITSPPPALADTSQLGQPAVEHVPIQMIPLSLRENQNTRQREGEALLQPIIDIRKMLALATTLFLITIILVLLFQKREKLANNISS